LAEGQLGPVFDALDHALEVGCGRGGGKVGGEWWMIGEGAEGRAGGGGGGGGGGGLELSRDVTSWLRTLYVTLKLHVVI
jgi:hypothetical protein